MRNFRKHGNAPCRIAVIHGGPGAPGSVAAVAEELAESWGVLEPYQTADSLEGQVAELRDTLMTQAVLPVVLIGWSWGAMLSVIVAARYPTLVRKLILVSSGVYEARYAAEILPTRLARLSDAEQQEITALMNGRDDLGEGERDAALARVGKMFKTRSDAYDPLPDEHEGAFPVRHDIHERVWAEAEALRHSGELVAMARAIRCPVVALHGDYDPHPVEGVREPLARVVRDFRLIVIEKCGHYPWLERQARDTFFAVLRRELGEQVLDPAERE
ncbi:MAG: alpha/beta hydrolase [Chloroflexi bacterium]|nr:alpha/beta hydrolase [Chloroflexota bacterium]